MRFRAIDARTLSPNTGSLVPGLCGELYTQKSLQPPPQHHQIHLGCEPFRKSGTTSTQTNHRPSSRLLMLALGLALVGCQLLLFSTPAQAQACICQVGAQRCQGNVIEKCDVDCLRWYTFQTCGAGSLCENGQCKTCQCTPGSTKCNGQDVQMCQPDCNSWQTTSSCSVASNTYCSSGTCNTCQCTPGLTKCIGPDIYVCNAACSGWTKQQTCPASQYCLGGACTNCQCAAGSQRCNGANVETCDGSCQSWSTTTTCPATTKCVSHNNTTSCQPQNWCPYTAATKTPICNQKVCLNNSCQPWDCSQDNHCNAGQICANYKCENASCSYNNTTGISDPACIAKAANKGYCAKLQCRECRLDAATGQIASECQTHHPGRDYCAAYKCVECPHNNFTAFSACSALNSNLTHCLDYKCVQCQHKLLANDISHCGGKACVDYKCAECSNNGTAQWDTQCVANKPGFSYCSNYKCVECSETGSVSAICRSKYTNKPYCNNNNECVECADVGKSSFCQSQLNLPFCYDGKCRQCSSPGTKANDPDCTAAYSTNRPHCHNHLCVECTTPGNIGAYDQTFCASKNGSSPADKRYCANSICVQCPDQAAQKSAACPPDQPICANYKCQQCVGNQDCPTGQNCVASQCQKTTEQCGQCTSDAWCQQNASTGANCGTGKNRCNPRSNTCVHCLIDTDCPTGQSCNLTTNVCATNSCPAFCTTANDCAASLCGANTACVNNTCTKPTTGSSCEPPNIILITDFSCSMKFVNSSTTPDVYLVDTRQPCVDEAACSNYLRNIVPAHPYTVHYDVRCTYSNSVGQKTCRATRWDVAMSALRKVVYDYGGTAANGYADRKVRWGKIFFSDYGDIPNGNTAPTNLANWGGLSDTPNTVYLLNTMRDKVADGGTNYVAAFNRAKSHLTAAFATDAVVNRKTALVFTTDGAPNEGCGPSQSPSIVNQIYSMVASDGKPRKIKSYIVGFGSGLGVNGETCLKSLAAQGRTNALKCNSGRCLEFYAADSAADLSNALQDIINQATQEECDGIDNDCDGLIDNNTVDACSCVMSYTRPNTTAEVDPQGTDYRVGVRLYTFIASFDRLGTCPTIDTPEDIARKQYMEACRNQAGKATQCLPNKNLQLHPASDAYQLYATRCCGNGTTNGTCSWPTSHACQSKPWGGSCISSLTAFCKANKELALNCLMPKGVLMRSGTGYDINGQLTVLSITNIGEDVLSKQSRRSIFVHIPGKDYRTTTADNRPLIASVSPDNYLAPSPNGTTYAAVTTDHVFHPANAALTQQMVGIDTTYCVAADCAKDREDLIWFLLGYDGAGNVTRKNRLGGIYHSTPVISQSVRDGQPDPGYNAWTLQTIPAGSFTNKTVVDRPPVLYVGSADGIMHAFSVNTGLELWGYIPKTFLESDTRDTLREGINGIRKDGTRTSLLDGSPLVEDVQMYRRVTTAGDVESKWRTVLIFGLRAGGKAFVAVDVTNPYQPRLLWEISNHSLKDPTNPAFGKFDQMGLTYGQPTIANVLFRFDSVLQERAVAFLPGGIALKRTDNTKPWELDFNSVVGSVVYAVDLETGRYLTALSSRHSSADCNGNPVVIERGIAAGPVSNSVSPRLTDRLFFGDIHANIFRAQLSDPTPSNWTVQRFYSVFRPCETPRPLMTTPSLAINDKGELVLFGGTGDLENMDNILTENKVFSVREAFIPDSSNVLQPRALPNFAFKLNKMLGAPIGNETTKDIGQELPQVQATSPTGERITGPPIIFGGTAYFTTYITQSTVPICGVRGFSRLYGIHFNDGCRTENCYPLASGTGSHFYHKVAGFVNNGGTLGQSHTPIRACEDDGQFNSNTSDPPKDQTILNNEQLNQDTCGDLNFTVPMLQNSASVAPFEYYRYLPLGKNTLVTGLSFSFQPSETQVANIRNPNTGQFSGHTFRSTQASRPYLAFQVAGNSPATDANWRLQNLRAVSIPPDSRKRGAFSTIGVADSLSPISVVSWGRVLD